MQTVLITGASGFCGTHLIERLRSRGEYRIVGADYKWDPSRVDRFDETVSLDVTKANDVASFVAAQSPDIVFHLAGLSDGSDDLIYGTNIIGTINILQALKERAPSGRLLIAGSSAEYGNVLPAGLPVNESALCSPTNPNGISKYAATLAALNYAHRYGLRIVCVRPFNIIGPGMPNTLAVGAFVQRILENKRSGSDTPLRVGRLDTSRDFVAVEDLVDGYCRLVESDCWGEVVNLCSGRAQSLRYVVDFLVSMMKHPINIEVDPALVRASDVPSLIGDWSKAHRLCGFEPRTTLEESLRLVWERGMGTANA
ncbi:MAG: NAD-dependent epimerase/dehydratase family protein [bacterium]